jgi:hypothetical protein
MLDIVREEGGERVRILISHHKTDRRSNPLSSKPIDFKVPVGDLTDLLLWWLRRGWVRVREGPGGTEGNSPYVFSSRGNRGLPIPKPFTHVNLCDYWKQLLKTTAPPSISNSNLSITLCRTVFIEAATSRCEEEDWEGMATLMGNSTKTWVQRYAPTLKRRRCQDAADRFDSLFNGVAGPSTSSSLVPSSLSHPMQSARSPTPPSPPPLSSSLMVPTSACLDDGDSVFNGDGTWRGWEECGSDW